MAVYKGTNLISGNIDASNETLPLLTPQWSDHTISHVSWLRADDFNWYDGTLYSLAYQELQSEYNNESTTIEKDLLSSNYSIVGSPTLSGPIVSGFATNSYLTSTAGSTVNTPASFEIGIKVTTGASFASSGRIFNPVDGADSTTSPFVACSSGGVYLYFYNGSTYATYIAKTSISTNTTYWFKWVYDGTNVYSYYSTDGTTYTLNETKAKTFAPYFRSNVFSIGGRAYDKSSACVWNGSIDLSECYMIVNDNRWWEPYKTLTYRRTPKGYKIANTSEETNILTKYNSKGIAWYYILDTDNTRFKLPRTKFGLEGLKNTVGNDIDESLPNITGSLTDGYKSESGGTGNGALYAVNTGVHNIGSGSGWQTSNIYFDASRSSSTYKNNAPVQERATQMYLYFYVGQFTQTAIMQTASINSALFANKAGIDLDNLSNTGKEYTSSAGMPSNRTQSMTIGSSGTIYNAPANGWFTCAGKSTAASGYISFESYKGLYQQAHVQASGEYLGVIRPVMKNDTLQINYSNMTILNVTFTYAEGN